VEHDLGRLHISDLEEATKLYREEPKTIHKLGIIAGASGYANLLKRHIGKENEVVYPYAEKSLSPEILASVDERVRAFEEQAEGEGVQKYCLELLEELVSKYSSI
jgi:hemerythrin-like domain-containing protein